MQLCDDQLELLQEFINDTPPGVYDAWDLIPDEYAQYFASRTKHGEYFKKAIGEGKLAGIKLIGLDLSSKHLRYSLHNG